MSTGTCLVKIFSHIPLLREHLDIFKLRQMPVVIRRPSKSHNELQTFTGGLMFMAFNIGQIASPYSQALKGSEIKCDGIQM